MRDDQDRHAVRAIEAAQELDDGSLAGDIHASGRFVEDEHVGLGRERSGEQHALLLAAGQGAKQVLTERVDADSSQRLAGRVAIRHGADAAAHRIRATRPINTTSKAVIGSIVSSRSRCGT